MSRFEIKIIAALLLIAVIPLAASVVLVGQVIHVSNSVAEGQLQRMAQPLDRAAEAYRGLFAARKKAFRLQGKLIATNFSLTSLEPLDRPALDKQLDRVAQQTKEIEQVELVDAAGHVLGRTRPQKRFSPEVHRDLRLSVPLGPGGHSLRITFYTPRAPFDDFSHLEQAQGVAAHLSLLRDKLATYYRVVFLVIFGAVLLVATGLGLYIARLTTRRVAALATATQKVAQGDLETQVILHTRDELGDLARSFNEMVRQIKENREKIAYLEKIGAWQEIARRLAHEIKNPLTPIQLAIQQLASKYDGNDERFSRLLKDAQEIITEEVNGLRRLVQDFSAFAKLPTVQPQPLDLEELLEDFRKSHPELQDKAVISWTAPDPRIRIQGDRMLLKHVLLNLVQNAVESAEEAGSVEKVRIDLIATEDRPRHRVVLQIEDNGPGMDEETSRRAFDPYFTTKEKGTGLGLAIIKKIVLEHNGTIALRSKKGEGTRFTLTLPLVGKEGRG